MGFQHLRGLADRAKRLFRKEHPAPFRYRKSEFRLHLLSCSNDAVHRRAGARTVEPPVRCGLCIFPLTKNSGGCDRLPLAPFELEQIKLLAAPPFLKDNGLCSVVPGDSGKPVSVLYLPGSNASHWNSSSPCWSALVRVHRTSSCGSPSLRQETHRLGFLIREGLITVPSSRKKPKALSCLIIFASVELR